MSHIARFCPKCGSAEGRFINGFCEKCFREDHELIHIEPEVEVEHCRRCGSIRLRGQWVGQSERSIAEFIESKARFSEFTHASIDAKPLPEERGITRAVVTVVGEIDGKPLKEEKEVLIKPKEVLCENCSRIAGDYYEAIIQLRFREKPKAEQLKVKRRQLEKLLSYERKTLPMAEIVRFEGHKNGFDAYIASRPAARTVAETLAKKYHTHVISSYKLKGLDRKGRPGRRFTFCIKI